MTTPDPLADIRQTIAEVRTALADLAAHDYAAAQARREQQNHRDDVSPCGWPTGGAR